MIAQRTTNVSVVIDASGQSDKSLEADAAFILSEVQNNKRLAGSHPYIRKDTEWFCSFCGDYSIAKDALFEESGFPVCCKKAQLEFIKEHEQIFTDLENQPNQYGVGLCSCGEIYDQSNAQLLAAKMCETCLDDAQ